MIVDVEQEREFYDHAYGRHFGAADHALACSREILVKQLNDPSNPLYERQKLYQGVLEALLSEPLKGKKALDYGCGTGKWGVMLAAGGARLRCSTFRRLPLKWDCGGHVPAEWRTVSGDMRATPAT